MKLSILIVSFLPLSFLAQSQWVEQDCDFTNIGIGEISITSDLCAWASGRGNPWDYVLEFTRTTDGGDNWIQGVIDSCVTCGRVSHLHALNCDTAFAMTFDPVDGGGALMRTNDGGLSWDSVNTADFSDPADFPNWVHFFNDQEGICMGDAIDGYFKIYRTTDGGQTWNRLPQANIPDTIGNEVGFTRLYDAVDGNIWFMTSEQRMFRSNDFGVNWEVSEVPDIGGIQFSFRDQDHGLAIPYIGGDTLLTTIDGGETWTVNPNFLPNDDRVYSIDYAKGVGTAPGAYVVVGDTLVTYSQDGGITWKDLSRELDFPFPATFLNVHTGWVGEPSDGISGDGIFKYVGTTLGIPNPEDVSSREENFTLFPNPSSGNVSIESKKRSTSNARVVVFDSQGRLLQKLEGLPSGSAMDLSALESGVYFVQITADDTPLQVSTLVLE